VNKDFKCPICGSKNVSSSQEHYLISGAEPLESADMEVHSGAIRVRGAKCNVCDYLMFFKSDP